MKKNVLITGATSGIGEACARKFAQGGYNLIITGRNTTKLASMKADLEAAGAAVITLAFDVRDAKAAEAAIQSLEGDWKRIDVLINNAGIAHYGLISQIGKAQWERMFAVNVHGMYHCIDAVLPGMLHRQAGCIINVSSMWGQVGASMEVCYSATKGAVIALTKALAKELGPSGIRVNCIAPGVILTEMCANVDPQTMDWLREETPVGRHGLPADVVGAMEYLVGADFVTGQVLPVNGGMII